MKNKITPTLLLLVFITCNFLYGQTILDPDDILRKGEQVPKVLLVGTFHFAYYGMDAHKTAEEDKVNVLSKEKQKEMAKLLDYIALFKPTKIVVEGGQNSGYLMQQYRRYKNGNARLRAREIDQICYPLMDRFNIDTLYGADARGMHHDLYERGDSISMQPYLDAMFTDWEFKSDNKWDKRYDELYDEDDKRANQMPLLQYFKEMNAEKTIQRSHGAYLVGDFELGEFRGADALAIFWYSRNLRIFRNIQRLETTPDDRIMVLFGAGHMGILKQLFESTPAYDLIPFNSLSN